MGKPGRPKTRIDGKCSKCGNNPAVEGQAWCLRCRANYQKERNLGLAAQSEAKGFARGVEAMVVTLADEFARFPGVPVKCDEVADKIRLAPRPIWKPS
jgi:hypothetical protein